MQKTTFCTWFIMCVSLISCVHKPSKVEILRMEKQRQDSIEYCQAQQTLHYSDSVLQVLLPQSDEQLRVFRYEKNEDFEDYGHYVHRLLVTNSNVARNFLQAYVSDNRKTTIQCFYYGVKQQNQLHVRVSVGDLYIEKEGSNHAFESEGWHEILTIESQDAIEILQFIASHTDDRIRVTMDGKNCVQYFLNTQEKQALADTYQLAVLMNDIDQLERAIRMASLQIQKYQKRHDLQ